MANFLDRFRNVVVGSEDKIYDIKDVISPSGDFQRISDVDVIINSWVNILLTPTGTVDNDPEFGCDVYKYVFEPLDDYTRDGILNEVRSKIQRYDNRGNIAKIEVSYLNNSKGFAVEVTADYKGKYGSFRIPFDERMANTMLG